MSEKDYYVIDRFKGSAVRLNLFEVKMRRSIKTIIKEALQLIWKDIKDMKIALLAIAAYFWIGKSYLYSGCIWVMLTGFPCPACGMTRAGFALLRGDFRRAFEIHPFIYAIAALFIAFCIWRYVLRRNQKVFVKWTIVLILAMVLFYIYRMITMFPGEPPMSYYRNNLIYTVWKLFKGSM